MNDTENNRYLGMTLRLFMGGIISRFYLIISEFHRGSTNGDPSHPSLWHMRHR